jgi:sigma-B regulation protein RsbU (phosphoserine phosphatase)
VAGDDIGLGKLVFEDVRAGKLREAYRRDLRDIYRFYLTDDQRERLARMGRVKRFFWVVSWLIRNLLIRLAPARRILLIVAAVLFLVRPEWTWGTHVRFDLDFSRGAFVLVLIVLMLELKDKLLARDEIEVARQVQLSLLPKAQPAIEGWDIWSATTPANDVGGDLIDYLDGAGGRTGIALGDVAGKGMGAALLCAKLQATLRALAPAAANLEALGASLNGVLERSGLDNRYATLFYAEISADSSEVLYLNAGHNPALLVRGDTIELLAAASLPLGMLPGVAYTQGTATLRRGDVLVLYSDGITEATNASGEEYGLPRLQSAVRAAASLSAEAAARQIIESAGRFVEGEKPHDDQSILILRRTNA